MPILRRRNRSSMTTPSLRTQIRSPAHEKSDHPTIGTSGMVSLGLRALRRWASGLSGRSEGRTVVDRSSGDCRGHQLCDRVPPVYLASPETERSGSSASGLLTLLKMDENVAEVPDYAISRARIRKAHHPCFTTERPSDQLEDLDPLASLIRQIGCPFEQASASCAMLRGHQPMPPIGTDKATMRSLRVSRMYNRSPVTDFSHAGEIRDNRERSTFLRRR